MRKKIWILIAVLVLTIAPTESFGSSIEPYYLSVKVSPSYSASDSIALSSEAGFNLYDEGDLEMELLYIQEGVLYITAVEDELLILDEDDKEIFIIPNDGSILIASGDFRDSIIKVGQNKYRDYIKFVQKGNYINVINHIELDHYLYGVVPREMGSSFPIEALKAQAIIARSYALANIKAHAQEGYNLCDTTHCQVYGAYDNEHPTTNKAVDETRGEYISYNGRVISANYHSNSGGMTENCGDVWSQSLPYLASVEDSFSDNAPNSSWEISYSPSEIQSRLASSGINIGQIMKIDILEVSDANRVLSLKITGTNGEKKMTGAELRSTLGVTKLKSTWFSVNKEGGSESSKVYVISGDGRYPIELNNAHIIDGRKDIIVNRSAVNRAKSIDRTARLESTYSSSPASFIFNGRGYGHGVGMSQYGAREMANQGYDYKDIIRHYYTSVEIEDINR